MTEKALVTCVLKHNFSINSLDMPDPFDTVFRLKLTNDFTFFDLNRLYLRVIHSQVESISTLYFFKQLFESLALWSTNDTDLFPSELATIRRRSSIDASISLFTLYVIKKILIIIAIEYGMIILYIRHIKIQFGHFLLCMCVYVCVCRSCRL